MITKATLEQAEEIKQLWKICFPKRDPRYVDYFFKNLYNPDNTYVNVQEGKIAACVMRFPHAMMFNNRVIQNSMLVGAGELPEYKDKGMLKDLMDVVLDACEHSELVTLIQTDNPEEFEQYNFRTIYKRNEYTLERKDVKRITNFGCAYEATPIDLLKVYSAFIKRFNGFYARDLQYFVEYKQMIIATGGKIVAYYDGKDQIRGYAIMIPRGTEIEVSEIVYLDSMSLMKLCNAALQERRVIHLHVSEAEDLTKLFPEGAKQTYPSTMVRLNDASLFMRLFNRHVTNVEDAFAISSKPLNLNEMM